MYETDEVYVKNVETGLYLNHTTNYDTIYSDLIFKKTIIANNKLVIGKVYLKKEAYKDAQIYFESALKLFKEQDLSSKIAQCYRYLSQIHNKLKETDKAINYATFALET